MSALHQSARFSSGAAQRLTAPVNEWSAMSYGGSNLVADERRYPVLFWDSSRQELSIPSEIGTILDAESALPILSTETPPPSTLQSPLQASSTLKKRRLKMNKHKYRKRKKRDRRRTKR